MTEEALRVTRPDRNITGITGIGPEFDAKRLEPLREALPKARRVGVLTGALTWTRAYGSAWESAPWTAVQRAVWATLK